MTLLFLESNWSTSIGEDIVFFLLILQFFVGVVELVAALVLTIVAAVNKKPMRGLAIYWALVFIYFLVLALLVSFSRDFDLPEEIIIAWFFSAWIIAIYFPFYKRFDRKPVAGLPPQQPMNNYYPEQTNTTNN